MDLFTPEDYKKLFQKSGPNANNALGMKEVKDKGGATEDQQGPMNEREPENYYLAEDEGKKRGRGSDGPVSDMPGSTVGLTPKNPRPGVNEDQQEQFNKLDMQKQQFGDSVVNINRDHDLASVDNPSNTNTKGFTEPGLGLDQNSMTTDYRSGYGNVPNDVAPDGKDAPQYASRKNPVWGDNITDRYHGKGTKNPAGISADDSALFSFNGAQGNLEAEAKGKPNGDVMMKDINPKVVQPLTTGPIGASRGGRGARASEDSGIVKEEATLGNLAPSPFGENTERNGQTAPGNGNDRGCPTSYFKFHGKKPAKPGDPLAMKDGIGQHDRMLGTPDTNPISPATDMMANIGSIEFGGDEDKDKQI